MPKYPTSQTHYPILLVSLAILPKLSDTEFYKMATVSEHCSGLLGKKRRQNR